MKYLTYLITVGGLMVTMNLPVHATNLSTIVQVTNRSNNSRDVVVPIISSPAPGSDRR